MSSSGCRNSSEYSLCVEQTDNGADRSDLPFPDAERFFPAAVYSLPGPTGFIGSVNFTGLGRCFGKSG